MSIARKSVEDLKQQEADALQTIAEGKRALAAVRAKQQARAKAARTAREEVLGKLAYAAGLGAVEDGILAQALTTLREQLLRAQHGGA